jgi:hypothetical protein
MITFLVIANTFFLYILGVYCVYCLSLASWVMKEINTNGYLPSDEEQREYSQRLKIAAFFWPVILPFKIW